MRLAALSVVLAALVAGVFVAVGGHGSAEAAKTPGTCIEMLHDSFSDHSVPWDLGPEWQIGPTSESSGQEIGFPDPAEDHTSGSSDNGVAGVVIGGNATTEPHPSWYITSPEINIGPNVDVAGVNFWRWLNSDAAPDMVNTVEVYNGADWITLWTGAGITEDEWTYVSYDLTAYRGNAIRIRIGVSVGSAGAHVVSSWNIDDLSVAECHSLPPPPPPPPPPPSASASAWWCCSGGRSRSVSAGAAVSVGLLISGLSRNDRRYEPLPVRAQPLVAGRHRHAAGRPAGSERARDVRCRRAWRLEPSTWNWTISRKPVAGLEPNRDGLLSAGQLRVRRHVPGACA